MGIIFDDFRGVASTPSNSEANILNLQKNDIISTLLGSFLIIVICRLVKIYISNLYVSVFVSFILSVIVYGIVLILFKNT